MHTVSLSIAPHRFLGFIVVLGLAIPAFGQEKAKPDSDTDLLLEEILVTAQKRDQSAQSIPISVHVFSAEMMHRLKADTLFRSASAIRTH